MLSFDTLSKIEQLLMSKSHPGWGEFVPLARIIGEVQQEKDLVAKAMQAPQVGQQAQSGQEGPGTAMQNVLVGAYANAPGPKEPPTPLGHVEVG